MNIFLRVQRISWLLQRRSRRNILFCQFEICPKNHFTVRSFEDDASNSAKLLPFFFLCSVLHVAVIHILQLPGNFSHIWLEALEHISVHRCNQNLLRAQESVCSEMFLLGSAGTEQDFLFSTFFFFHKGERSSAADPHRASAGLRAILNCDLVLTPPSFSKSTERHQKLSLVPRLQPI